MKEQKRQTRAAWFLCRECQKRLGNLGYIITESERAPSWRACALCGSMALIRQADLAKPKPKYQKRTGAGERERASRRGA